ncbi:MAG: alanine--glyoxylate aminotransferase family protein [Thermoanaerobacteraceae bacterium]|nr:alanine--glyoxylate aminotransferase family protein [Thermoanaerobacteraceae bacterium]
MGEKILLTPGPTMLPDRVRRAMESQPAFHRSDEFYKIFSGFNENLKRIFKTNQPVMTLTSSGTGGLEALVSNVFSRGDKALGITVGEFGDRFIEIAKSYGVEVDELRYEWGTAARPDDIEGKLRSNSYKAILITHNETSTGVVNDIKTIAEICHRYNALILVDAVSSLGGLELDMDGWGLDGVVTCSQKCLMGPPGLAFVALSDRAWEATKKSDLPHFYFDLNKAKKGVEKINPDTPYTPAVSTIMAVSEGLNMLDERLDVVYNRQMIIGNAVRKAVDTLGLRIFARENYSDCITGIYLPDGISSKDIIGYMYKEGVVIASGQGRYKENVIRLGHMGYCTKRMLIKCFDALEDALTALGFKLEAGLSIETLDKELGELN